MDNEPAEDPTKARDVVLKLRLSQKAIDSLIDLGLKPLGGRGGELQLLATAFTTICMDIRDEQHKPLELTTPDGRPIVPALHRRADLMIAGRQAAVAITQIELALGIALKAAARVG